MRVACGLDRLLAEAEHLRGRRFGLLAHGAAVSGDLRPAHLALAEVGRAPTVLLAPEHGYHGVEQDMVAASARREPWTGLPIVSLYGDRPESLRPAREVFDGLDLLVVDLQDVGARYYTYAATAVWAAEVAQEVDCEIWVLDRPNPLGGVEVEGNLPLPGLESFVSAFRTPVRHGLTLGELVLLEARRRGWAREPRVWTVDDWHREELWGGTGRPWLAPSPNMPTPTTAQLYPGLCLIEATELSEGRGTTRPFQLVGAPDLDSRRLVEALAARGIPGLGFLPSLFRPQFQKHAGRVCAGVEIVVTDPRALRPFRAGLTLLEVLYREAGEAFDWRREPYEFVTDRPAIDLLCGDPAVRKAIEAGTGLESWIESWSVDETEFRLEREEVLLYR